MENDLQNTTGNKDENSTPVTPQQTKPADYSSQDAENPSENARRDSNRSGSGNNASDESDANTASGNDRDINTDASTRINNDSGEKAIEEETQDSEANQRNNNRRNQGNRRQQFDKRQQRGNDQKKNFKSSKFSARHLYDDPGGSLRPPSLDKPIEDDDAPEIVNNYSEFSDAPSTESSISSENVAVEKNEDTYRARKPFVAKPETEDESPEPIVKPVREEVTSDREESLNNSEQVSDSVTDTPAIKLSADYSAPIVEKPAVKLNDDYAAPIIEKPAERPQRVPGERRDDRRGERRNDNRRDDRRTDRERPQRIQSDRRDEKPTEDAPQDRREERSSERPARNTDRREERMSRGRDDRGDRRNDDRRDERRDDRRDDRREDRRNDRTSERVVDRNKRQQATQQSPAPQRISFRRVSIVIPLYNEEQSIQPLFSLIRTAMNDVRIPYEVIFVDDGSTDGSLDKIKYLARVDRNIKYISFQKNFGKSAALQMGFKSVTGDVVITMDADLQDDPREIPNLLKKLDEGYDVVSGWKKKRYDPFIKKISSKFFNAVTGLFSKVKLHDFNCGLKAYRRSAVNALNIYGEMHRYIPVLAHWKGFKISEIPVKHQPRKYGKTKFGVSRFFKGFIDLITVTFITRYLQRPMHLFGFLGAIAFIIGTIVNGYYAYLKLSDWTTHNIGTLMLGVLLTLLGVQLFAIGLIGELIAHNFLNEKEYTIKEKSV